MYGFSWNDRLTRQFLTNVGLITSDGPYGPNVMELNGRITYLIALSLIAVNIRRQGYYSRKHQRF